jgi:hypothetical protein
MGFWGVRVGSHGVKNMNDLLKFYRNVEEYSTFKGEKKKTQFGIVEKKLCCPDCFFNLWAVWAALKNSMFISEVNNMRSFVLWAVLTSLQKKTYGACF